MRVLDLPLPPHVPTLPVSQLLMFAEPVSAQKRTYEVLTENLNALAYSLVATNSGGRSDESVRASIARAPHQLNEATRLVQQRYAWRGYVAPGDEAFPAPNGRCAVTLIAEAGAAIVGTMTLGLDGPGGLLVGENYPDQISAARSEGRELCELTRLALAQRADTRTVLSTLFGLGYRLFTLHGATDVFIEVNPRHVAFYRRVLGFVVSAGERLCERVQAPAVLLRVSMEELGARLQAYTSKVVASGAVPFPVAQAASE